MVKAGFRILTLVLTALFWVEGGLAASISASVDRQELGVNETLTLEVKASTEIELNLGSLFNLSNLELPAPELGDLETRFEVLDRSQKYSIRSVNGTHNADITWTYLLRPLKTGKLTIPALKYKNETTKPITITVTEQASDGDARKDSAFLTVSVDKDSVYVQEQLLMTLRLHYQPALLGGELEKPELDNAIVEQLGEQRDFQTRRNGRQWQVVERQYLIYPQASGTLEIPRLGFNGRRRDLSNGELEFLRVRSEPITVTVKPPPESFSGDNWLPATSLVLEESWSSDPEQAQVGKSLTRTLRMRALGLLGSALPALKVSYPQQLKTYPEQPRMESERRSDSVESTRTEKTVLVPTEAGTVELPAIRIPWWDTVNDVERVATIPVRRLVVSAPPGNTSAAAPPTTEEAADGEGKAPAPEPGTGSPGSLWRWLAVGLGSAWLLTLALLLAVKRQSRQETAAVNANAPEASQDTSLEAIRRLARERDPAFFEQFPAWARQMLQDDSLNSAQAVIDRINDPELTEAVEALEASLYSPEPANPPDPEKLDQALKRLDARARQKTRTDGPQPLYPFDA